MRENKPKLFLTCSFNVCLVCYGVVITLNEHQLLLHHIIPRSFPVAAITNDGCAEVSAQLGQSMDTLRANTGNRYIKVRSAGTFND